MIRLKMTLLLSLCLLALLPKHAVSGCVPIDTTFHLVNTAVGGTTPAGDLMQPTGTGASGFIPTALVDATQRYWYTPSINATYDPGVYDFKLWTDAGAGPANVTVEIGYSNPNGSGYVSLGTVTKDVWAGAGNHSTDFIFNLPAVTLSNQVLRLRLVSAGGGPATMVFNGGTDFDSRLLTPGGVAVGCPTYTPTPCGFTAMTVSNGTSEKIDYITPIGAAEPGSWDSNPGFNDSGWPSSVLWPGDPGHPLINGSQPWSSYNVSAASNANDELLIRRVFSIPAGAINIFGSLTLAVDDNSDSYVNGNVVQSDPAGFVSNQLARTYPIAIGNFNPGSNLLSIRVESPLVSLIAYSYVLTVQYTLPCTTPTSTRTRTPTPTITLTQTLVSTPTFTVTLTRTPTPTDTPTFTLTRTPTSTLTATPTVTVTVTSTRTASPTSSFTVTSTPSYTLTSSPTLTRTATPSVTITVSQTLTSTRTDTSTATLTHTPTSSSTVSLTSTFSSTSTSSFTVTSTPTYSATRTSTLTASPTLTQSPTFTNTKTVTPGATPTFSLSSTSTLTATPTLTVTETSTVTVSSTLTATSTVTLTPSPTLSKTATQTTTPTSSHTKSVTPGSTPTATVTPTWTLSSTSTLSPTPTLTRSPTSSVTATPSSTITTLDTATSTSTCSPTKTVTITVSVTSTATFSPSVTSTPSSTQSPTQSPTAIPMPMHLSVMIYNSAGEKVKMLYFGSSQNMPGSFSVDQNGLMPGSSSASLHFGGLLQNGGSNLIWVGDNDNGQNVSGGTYYIKSEMTDAFGTVQAWTQSVTVLPQASGQTLNIYNSAGELVSTLSTSSISPSPMTRLGFRDPSKTAFVLGSSSGVEFVLEDASGNKINRIWDGRSNSGALVSSGSYTVQLVDNTIGHTVLVSKGFVLLADPSASGFSVVAGPNPVLPNHRGIVFSFQGLNAGESATLRLYSLAGELVAQAAAAIGQGSIELGIGPWSSGIYVAVLEARDGQALKSRKILKIALQR